MADLIPKEVSAAFEKALSYYRPGGGYAKGVEASLVRGEKKSTASGMQSLVSSGLAGTTMAAGLGKKYQEEVAAPTRARVEETRVGQMSSIEMALANLRQGAAESEKSRLAQAAEAEKYRLAQAAEAEKNRKAQQGSLMAQLRSREYLASLGKKSTKKPSMFSAFGSSKTTKTPGASSDSKYGSYKVPNIYGGESNLGGSYGSMLDPTPARASSLESRYKPAPAKESTYTSPYLPGQDYSPGKARLPWEL